MTTQCALDFTGRPSPSRVVTGCISRAGFIYAQEGPHSHPAGAPFGPAYHKVLLDAPGLLSEDLHIDD